MKRMRIIGMLSVLGLTVAVFATAQTAEDWAQKERAWKEQAKDAYVQHYSVALNTMSTLTGFSIRVNNAVFPVRPEMPEWGALTEEHVKTRKES